MTLPTELIYVDQERVACDGGDGAMGHPMVYLHIDHDEGHIDCPYCGRRFILRDDD